MHSVQVIPSAALPLPPCDHGRLGDINASAFGSDRPSPSGLYPQDAVWQEFLSSSCLRPFEEPASSSHRQPTWRDTQGHESRIDDFLCCAGTHHAVLSPGVALPFLGVNTDFPPVSDHSPLYAALDLAALGISLPPVNPAAVTLPPPPLTARPLPSPLPKPALEAFSLDYYNTLSPQTKSLHDFILASLARAADDAAAGCLRPDAAQVLLEIDTQL